MRDASPYKGLEPYSSEDRSRFFGREDDCKIMIAKLFSARVTLFFGVTGAGKSSLLGAGIIPELTDQRLDVTYHFKWNPREDPRISLKTSVKDTLFNLGKISSPEPPDWEELTVKEFLERYSVFASDPFIIIIDQFEEFFLYHAHSPFFDDFIKELSDAINDRNLSLTFILAMREDFLAELDIFWDKVPALSDNRYRLKKLTLKQAREAIVKPIQEAGFEYEPELVEQLLHDLSSQYPVSSDQYSVSSDQYSVSSDQYSVSSDQYPVSSIQHPASSIQQPTSSVEAPYLQIVCSELWQAEQDNPQKTLTLNQYNTLGKTQNIVRRHFERVMEKLSLRQQVLAFEMFHYLVTARGTKMTYRDEDLADTLGTPVEEIRQILTYLAERGNRILRSDKRPDGTWYELYHDIFAEIIKRWTEQFQEDENRHIYGQIVAAARKWSRASKDEAALLRGVRLRQADEWTQSHRENLSLDEREFVEASSKKHRQTRLLRRAVVGMIALLAVVAMFFGVSAEREKNEAERLRFVSIAQSLSVQALHQQKLDQDERAALLVRQAYLFNQRNQGNMLSQIDNALRTVLNTSYFNHTLHLHGVAMSVAISPNKKLVTGHNDGLVQLWNLQEPASEPDVLRGHQGMVWSVAFSPDGEILASGGWDGTVRLWNPQNPDANPTVLHGHKGIVWSVAFSPDGETLASGGSDATIRLWDIGNLRAEPRILRAHKGSVNAVAFSPDGQTLASGSSDKTVRLWNVQIPTGTPHILGNHTASVNAVAFSPDGQSLASGGSDKTVCLWNLQNSSTESIVSLEHSDIISSLIFSPDGQTLVSGSWDKTVRLWNLQNLDTDPIVLRGHDDLVFSVAFSPDGQFLVSGSNDSTARWWSFDKSSFETIILQDYKHEIKSLVFSPDGQTLIAAGDDGTVQQWNVHNGRSLGDPLKFYTDFRGKVSFSPDGKQVALGSDDGIVRVWQLNNPNATPTVLEGHTGRISSIIFSHDGQFLASGSEDKTVRLWDWKISTVFVLSYHEGPVLSLTFSPNGKILVAGSGPESEITPGQREDPMTIYLWDLEKPYNPDTPYNPYEILRLHQQPVSSIVFSPDGKMLVSSSRDKTLLWNSHRFREPPKTLKGRGGLILSLAFSPDGNTLASGSEDGAVRLWDPRNADANPVILHVHKSQIAAVAFSPDGENLAAGAQDGTIFIWRLTKTLADEICQQVWRNLTLDEWHQFVGKDIPYERTCSELPADEEITHP